MTRYIKTFVICTMAMFCMLLFGVVSVKAETCSVTKNKPIDVNLRIETINGITRGLLRITDAENDAVYVADAKDFNNNTLDFGTYNFSYTVNYGMTARTHSMSVSVYVDKGAGTMTVNGAQYPLDAGGDVEGLDFPEAFVEAGLVPVSSNYKRNLRDAKNDVGLTEDTISGTKLQLTSKYGNTGTCGLAFEITFWDRIADNMYNTQVAKRTLRVIYKWTEVHGQSYVTDSKGQQISTSSIGVSDTQYFQQFDDVPLYDVTIGRIEWPYQGEDADHFCYIRQDKVKTFADADCGGWGGSLVSTNNEYYQQTDYIIHEPIREWVCPATYYVVTCKGTRSGDTASYQSSEYTTDCSRYNWMEKWEHVGTKTVAPKESDCFWNTIKEGYTEYRYRRCQYKYVDKDMIMATLTNKSGVDANYKYVACPNGTEDAETAYLYYDGKVLRPIITWTPTNIAVLVEDKIEAAYEPVIKTIQPAIGKLTESAIKNRAKQYGQGRTEKAAYEAALIADESIRPNSEFPVYQVVATKATLKTYQNEYKKISEDAGARVSPLSQTSFANEYLEMPIFGVYLYSTAHWRAIDLDVQKNMTGGTAHLWEGPFTYTYDCSTPPVPGVDPGPSGGVDIETEVSLTEFEYIKIIYDEYKEKNPSVAEKKLNEGFYDSLKSDPSKAAEKVVEYVDYRLTLGDDISSALTKFFELFYLN